MSDPSRPDPWFQWSRCCLNASVKASGKGSRASSAGWQRLFWVVLTQASVAATEQEAGLEAGLAAGSQGAGIDSSISIAREKAYVLGSRIRFSRTETSLL